MHWRQGRGFLETAACAPGSARSARQRTNDEGYLDYRPRNRIDCADQCAEVVPSNPSRSVPGSWVTLVSKPATSPQVTGNMPKVAVSKTVLAPKSCPTPQLQAIWPFPCRYETRTLRKRKPRQIQRFVDVAGFATNLTGSPARLILKLRKKRQLKGVREPSIHAG